MGIFPTELAEDLKGRGYSAMDVARACLILWRGEVGGSKAQGFAYYEGPMDRAMGGEPSTADRMMCAYSPPEVEKATT